MSNIATDSKHLIALCRYTVKPGKEQEFEVILKKHLPTLDKVGLLAPAPRMAFRGIDQEKRTYYVELCPWKDAAAPNRAHELPEVMAVWEPMGALCDQMEFPHVEQIEL